MSALCKHSPAVICLAVFSLAVPTFAAAQTERDLDSHVHGASELNLVIDGNAVYIEYISPWANLIGFEHQPSTDEQLSLMTGAMDALAVVDELFVFNSEAACQSASVDVQSTVEVALDVAGAEEHAHAHDKDHSDKHADEEHAHAHDEDHSDKHADEEHAHDHGYEHTDGHAEVKTSYAFECADPSQLAELSVRLAESWPGIEEIAVQMAGPGGQTSVELDETPMVVDLSAVR